MNHSNWHNRLFFILPALAIVLVTGLSLLPTLSNGFVDWDDHVYLLNNPDIRIKEISWGSISNVIRSSYGEKNFLAWPVTVSFAVEYYFFGLNPLPYHATNLILHLFNCLLVFWFIYLLSKNRLIAFLVSMLFGIHPAHVESVAWVCERKDVLYTLFYMSSLIFYLYYKRSAHRKYYAVSVLLFFISISAKPMAVMLPAILILIELLEKRALNRRTLLELSPYLLICGYISLKVLFSQYFGFIKLPETRLTYPPHPNYVFYASFIPVYHLFQLFFPAKLSCIYPSPSAHEPMPLNYLLAPVLLIFFISAAVFFGKYSRKILFGFFFYFFSILPALEIFPVNNSILFDHYSYVPSIGIFYLLGVGCVWVLERKWVNSDLIKGILIAGIVLVITTLSVITWNQSKVWKDPFSLWENVAGHFPNYSSPLNNLGAHYMDQKNYDKASFYFKKAIQANPKDPLAHGNLVACDLAAARNNHARSTFSAREEARIFNKAIAGYSRAIAIDPTYPTPYFNRGLVFLNKKNIAKAFEDFNQTLRLNPRHTGALFKRGVCYALMNDLPKAITDFNEVLIIDPSDIQARLGRANLLLHQGRPVDALADYNFILATDSLNQAARLGQEVCHATINGRTDKASADLSG